MNPPLHITDHQASRVLEIGWDDGVVSRLPHALLRSRCRCAACEQQRRRGGAPSASEGTLRLVGLSAIADQGLNLAFSDGHDRGIYPWSYLRQLASG